MEHPLKLAVLSMILVSYALMITAGASLSLGSVQSGNSATVSPSGTAQFKILLFNAHETEGLQINVYDSAPMGWTVSISPSGFILPYKEIGDRTREDGYEFVGTGAGDVKAKPVWIRVSVPAGEKPGSYNVGVDLTAKKQNSGVAMSQSRSYTFRVNVVGGAAGEEGPGEEGGGGQAAPQQQGGELVQDQTEPENTILGVTQTDNPDAIRAKVEEQINSLTGMVISNPMIAPLALGIAATLFIALRALKKI